MKRYFSSAAVALTFVLLASPLAGQTDDVRNPHRHRGFWASFGMGYGALGCQDCGDRESGVGYAASLGGTVSQQVLLGVGAYTSNAWERTASGEPPYPGWDEGVFLKASVVAAMARFYPFPTRGLFLIGGLGLGMVTLGGEDLRFLGEDSYGVGGVVGVGYDLRPSHNFSLTPYANGFGVSVDGFGANVGQVGLAFTLH